jgi:RNA recognition motif-containing protein
MGNRIYVGNLPFSVTQEQLKELFSQYGEIEEAVVVTNKFSGRSKGFGFVSFKDEASADKAIAEMNKKEVEGRPLNVKEALPFDENRPRKRFGGRDRGRGGRGGFRSRGPRRERESEGESESEESSEEFSEEATE